MLFRRNQHGLTPEQIRTCQIAWETLAGESVCPLEVSGAVQSGSRTVFDEKHEVVFLGADAYPDPRAGPQAPARTRMSVLACLAHELAHARRYRRGYRRPLSLPDALIDEAEASLDASFEVLLKWSDRRDLVQDAGDQVGAWLRHHETGVKR